MKKSLLVIPTYNEVENISSLIHQVFEQKNVAEKLEILVVDDGSPDGTGDAVRTISQTNPSVHLLARDQKMGLGKAYVDGFLWGMKQEKFDAFIEMDADFSHHPTYLPTMLDYLETNDVVIGSRYIKGGGTKNWGLIRRIISKVGNLYAKAILFSPIQDLTGGFNGWKKQVLESSSLDTLRSDGYSFQIELKYRAGQKGYKIVEFPILFEDRKVGQSKMSKKIVLEALCRVPMFRFSKKQSF